MHALPLDREAFHSRHRGRIAHQAARDARACPGRRHYIERGRPANLNACTSPATTAAAPHARHKAAKSGAGDIAAPHRRQRPWRAKMA